MTLHARLTLLFLAVVQVTFLAAVGGYWGLHSWRLVTDDLAMVHLQQDRLLRVFDRLATDGNGDRLAPTLARLRRDAQTVDESRHVARVAIAVRSGATERARRAVGRLADYYRGELERLRARGAGLAEISAWMLGGIIVLAMASFAGFLVAIRSWLVEPVQTLERATEIMSTGDLEHRITLTGDDELARLAASINRMAASLATIQDQLVTSERFALLGELASYVAHNIRNPLASIRATAQGEAIELADVDPRRAALTDIVRAVDRLDAWVADLLRSMSPVALERRPGSLRELVARCIELIRPRLQAEQIGLELRVSEMPLVAFDHAKLEQVVSAVLANAADATPPGGSIDVSVARDTDRVALRIADPGRGITANGRGRLFTPFSTTKASGTGLGLWLSQKIVIAHGGRISLRDGKEGGTVVEITLPLGEESGCRAS